MAGGDSFIVAVRIRPPNERETAMSSRAHHTIIVPVTSSTLVYDPPADRDFSTFSSSSSPGSCAGQPTSYPSRILKCTSASPTSSPLSKSVSNSNRHKDTHYAFDHVFDGKSTQEQVYQQTAAKVVSRVLDGVNASVFAYGATGCGKTHTMIGTQAQPGVMIQTMHDIFARIKEREHHTTFHVSLSYLEVYNEHIYDLLGNDVPQSKRIALELREEQDGSMLIAGLSTHNPKSAEEVFAMLESGNRHRTSSPTEANSQSSRSHGVLQVVIRSKESASASFARERCAKLSLIDLAGSERAAVSSNRGQTLKEGANINRSLLSLGNCINALAARAKAPAIKAPLIVNKTPSKTLKTKANKENIRAAAPSPAVAGFVPFRDSKLTRLLKDSLGGNTLTVMIACVSPSSLCAEDSHNTLKYANRAKDIQCVAVKNERSVAYHMTQMEGTIEKLILEVETWKTLCQRSGAPKDEIQDNMIELWRTRLNQEWSARKSIEDAIAANKSAMLINKSTSRILRAQLNTWKESLASSFEHGSTHAMVVLNEAEKKQVLQTLTSAISSCEQQGAALHQAYALLIPQVVATRESNASTLQQMKRVLERAGALQAESMCARFEAQVHEMQAQHAELINSAYSSCMQQLFTQWTDDKSVTVEVLKCASILFNELTPHSRLQLHSLFENSSKLAARTALHTAQNATLASESSTGSAQKASTSSPAPPTTVVKAADAAPEFRFQYSNQNNASRPSQLPDAPFISARASQFNAAVTAAASASSPTASRLQNLPSMANLFSSSSPGASATSHSPSAASFSAITKSSCAAIDAEKKLRSDAKTDHTMSPLAESDEEIMAASSSTPVLSMSSKMVRRVSDQSSKKFRALESTAAISAAQPARDSEQDDDNMENRHDSRREQMDSKMNKRVITLHAAATASAASPPPRKPQTQASDQGNFVVTPIISPAGLKRLQVVRNQENVSRSPMLTSPHATSFQAQPLKKYLQNAAPQQLRSLIHPTPLINHNQTPLHPSILSPPFAGQPPQREWNASLPAISWQPGNKAQFLFPSRLLNVQKADQGQKKERDINRRTPKKSSVETSPIAHRL